MCPLHLLAAIKKRTFKLSKRKGENYLRKRLFGSVE
jgi:hypothetical protein